MKMVKGICPYLEFQFSVILIFPSYSSEQLVVLCTIYWEVQSSKMELCFDNRNNA